ncbi:MAG: GIY-YIG nuclease family protein [Betaproteobacteria bacterium]|nr:GIY-YIG nuclease family protein [Betaproteobacteria bacterium]
MSLIPIPEDNRYSNTAGFVYILSNPSMPGILKIGSTERTVKERVAELSATTGVPTPFRVEHYILTEDPKGLEQSLHEELSEFRVNGNREFFKVSVDELLKKYRELRVQEMVSEMQLLNQEQVERIFRQLYWLYPSNPTFQSIEERSKPQIVEALLKLNNHTLIDVIQEVFWNRPAVRKAIR